MKFIIQREELLKPLQIANGVIDRRQVLPILSNVLIELLASDLAITASDLDVEVNIKVKANPGEEGRITLPARKLLDICRALPEGAELEFSLNNDRVTILSGKSRFQLSTLPATQFPNIEEVDPTLRFTIAQGVFKKLIDKTFFAMANQDVRYYLNGLLIEVAENTLRAVATDGHRLAYSQALASIHVLENSSFIIPRKGVSELQKLLADVEQSINVEIGTNHIRINTDTIKFTTKLIDGVFPDYQRVIPQNADKLVVVGRDALRQAVMRTSILTNEKYRSIRLQLESGRLRVWAHNPEQEEAEEELPVDYVGAALEIGFNSTYLLDALGGVGGEKVELRLSDQHSCCLIQAVGENQSKYVVMPMRL